MSKYRDLAMAKKDSAMAKASSLKGGVKGKVNGVLGRKSSTSDAHSDRAPAAPLHTLRDPSSFTPPPRRTTSGLTSPSPSESASRNLITAAPSRYQGNQGYQGHQGHQGNDDYDEAPVPPSRPYRVNTTGLSTDHLPPPPARRDGANEKSPPSYDAPMSARRAPPQPQPRPQPHAPPTASPSPSLPPRLPPRSDSSGSERVISAMPSSSNLNNLNQGAISRLGAVGIRVPAFGIGKPRADADEDAAPPPKPPRPMASQPNLVQSRLSKPLAAFSSSSSAEDVASPPQEGTTWAQKQAALRTASAFHKDPSSISFADAKAAASTANNFRQRHGHQVAAGVEAANSVNQKYGVADRIGALAAQHSSTSGANQGGSASAVGQQLAAGATAVSALAGKKKPPPPPPPPAKKKPSLAGQPRNDASGDDDVPPPVPFATRPSF